MQHIADISQQQLTQHRQRQASSASLAARSAEIRRELHVAGAVWYNLVLPETHALAAVLQEDEHIDGVVYGRYSETPEPHIGRGALVATDRRLILIDKKPLFMHCNEIMYEVVSNVAYSRTGFFGATVALNTRLGDIRMHTFNQKCSRGFVRAIETHIFHPPPEG